ncbi:MAG: formate dehydrogenase [Bacteroidia bacterium]|nr:MAG: formate dehydrogenase [Bacteroidia bacterium]
MAQYGILIDITRCVGCLACEEACAEKWGMSEAGSTEVSAFRNTEVREVDGVYVPKQCMHCADPTCVSVCPVGAFTKTPEGPVIYEPDKCMGCRYCLQACPFDVPKYEWDSLNPAVRKCNMCHERILQGKQPACVETCPAEARTFGILDNLVEEARKRIAESPETYENRIYGVREAGGTSVLFLAPKPFDQLGLKTNLPEHPLPTLTWEVLSKIPNYVFWSSTLLAGIWWITNRRNEVQAYEAALKKLEERGNGRNHPTN